jgi:hypothetical protein
MDMIRLTEEIVSKQAVETTDILNLRKGAVNNMVDVRACNKPGKRVSSVRLAKIVKSWVLMESRRVLLGRRDIRDVRRVFIGLLRLHFYNVFVIKQYMMRGFPVSFHGRLTFVHDSGSALICFIQAFQAI